MSQKKLDRWMGVEQEWAVPIRDEQRRRAAGESDVPVNQMTYARELIYALYSFRFEDGSAPFLWLGRNMTQRNSYARGLLRNGGYYEHQWNHIETSTSECRNHYELVKYDRANEVWMYISLLQFRKIFGLDINCWKATLDARGVSRATHESYDCDRARFVPYQDTLIPFFIVRQLFAGSGGILNGKFVISPRALVLDTAKAGNAGARCILHTYDERLIAEDSLWTDIPAYTQRYRSHQGFGDAVRLEPTSLLKYGITSYVISALEDGILKRIDLHDPLETIKQISSTPEGPWRLDIGVQKLDAVDYLESYVMEALEKLFAARMVKDHDRRTLSLFKFVVEKLKQGCIEDLRNDVQWVMTKYFLDHYLDYYEFTQGYTPQEKMLSAVLEIANVAHDEIMWLDLIQGLEPDEIDKKTKPLKANSIFTDEEIKEAVLNPPAASRASLRVALAKRFPVREIDWHVVVMAGEDTFRSLGGLEGWNDIKIKGKLEEFERKE